MRPPTFGPDFWGAYQTEADESYSSAVVAVDYRTGAVRWVFQTTHHDPRALDAKTGQELWKGRMPVGSNTAPMSYVAANGKQYILINAGGAPRATKDRGDLIIAYALPGRSVRRVETGRSFSSSQA